VRKGNCSDNAAMASVCSTSKIELGCFQAIFGPFANRIYDDQELPGMRTLAEFWTTSDQRTQKRKPNYDPAWTSEIRHEMRRE
jgi:hypothetical protein